jgi:hypothetical protein
MAVVARFESFPTLATERLELCQFLPDYAPDVFAYLSSPLLSTHEARKPFTDPAQADRSLQLGRSIRESSRWV